MSFRALNASRSRLIRCEILLARRCASSKSPLSHQIRQHVLPRFHSFQSDVATRARQAATSLSSRATALGSKLNEVTGYEQVEQLKAQVAQQEKALQLARTAATEAKIAYDMAVAKRSSAQREVNSLLERKHSWSDADVSAFTTLVRTDHASAAEVVSSSQSLKEKELAVDKAFTDLTSAILHRYHEEQVWSDKIRSVATWANVIGLAFNLFIFLIAIAIVEPWKRRRLVERLEERTAGLMERVDSQIAGLRLALDRPSDPPIATSPPDLIPDLMPETVAPSMSLASEVLKAHCDIDLPLTEAQSHLAGAALGAIGGIIAWTVLSSVFR